jgi:hypothetical protein
VADEDGDDVEKLVGVVVREGVRVAERVLQKARANNQTEGTVMKHEQIFKQRAQ